MEWAFLFLFFGFMFVVAEIFFPSFGLLSVLAAACLLVSVVLGFRESATWGAGFVAGIVIMLPIVIVTSFRILPKTKLGKRLILSGPDPSSASSSFSSSQDLLSRIGRTTSPLRPSGIAEIDGRRVDVVADGEMIEAEVTVRVTKVEGNRIVVERIEGETAEVDSSSEIEPLVKKDSEGEPHDV